jgi:Holliday junction DNA helicase RuvB
MRPEPVFCGFIGQRKLVRQLKKLVTGAGALGIIIIGFLFKGRPGLGKTLLAKAIASYQGVVCHVVECNPGFSVEKCLVPHLRKIKAGDILFIDEGHLMPHPQCVLLQRCLDRNGTVTVGDFIESKAEDDDSKKEIPLFTLVLATDQPAKLPKALKSRLRQFTIDYYSQPELHAIISEHYRKIGVSCTPQAANMIAKISKGVPRTGIMHADGIWYHAKADGKASLTIDECRSYFAAVDIDEETGLDDVDAAYLKALYGADKPLSIRSISCLTHADKNTLYNDVEPFLLKSRLVRVDKEGRVLEDGGIRAVERILRVEKERARVECVNEETSNKRRVP